MAQGGGSESMSPGNDSDSSTPLQPGLGLGPQGDAGPALSTEHCHSAVLSLIEETTRGEETLLKGEI